MSEPRERRRRRVSRPAPEGVDTAPSDHPLNAPAAEDAPRGWGGEGGTPQAGSRSARAAGENDSRLTRDRPPHWG